MTGSEIHPDERLNLRPLVLGVCFAWGLACGLLVNLMSDPEERAAGPGAAQQAGQNAPAQPALSQEGAKERALINEALDRIGTQRQTTGQLLDVKNTVPGPGGDEAAIEPLNAGRPPLPEISLRSGWGLTGRSADRPSMPLEVPDGPPLPQRDKVRRLENLPPPELD